jgi:hypothetical protein
MPRIFSVRRRVGDGRDFSEAIARVNAASGVSEGLRLWQVAPRGVFRISTRAGFHSTQGN